MFEFYVQLGTTTDVDIFESNAARTSIENGERQFFHESFC